MSLFYFSPKNRLNIFLQNNPKTIKLMLYIHKMNANNCFVDLEGIEIRHSFKSQDYPANIPHIDFSS